MVAETVLFGYTKEYKKASYTRYLFGAQKKGRSQDDT